jgi:hypothetical protein
VRIAALDFHSAREHSSLQWLRREGLVLAGLGGFGLLILPALIYLVGQQLLGEYRPGATMATFYADLYSQLGAFSPWAWVLVLGPWLAIQLLRLLWLPLRRVTRRPPRESGQKSPITRVEPMI